MIPDGFFKAWAVTAVFLLAVDAVWLGFVAKDFYRRELGDMMLEQVRFGIAALFYVFFAAAIVLLAGAAGLRSESLATAAVYGAVLGLAAYGTYDITNLATLKGWSVAMSLVDMAWGTALTSASAVVAFLVLR